MAAPAYMPTAHLVAPRPLFLLQQAQYAQVFLLKHVSFCIPYAGFSSTNKFATSFLSVYRSVFTILFSSPSLWQELSSLPSRCIGLQWVPGHSFLPGNDAADELARRGALLAFSVISCSLSSYILYPFLSFLGLEA